MDSDSQQRRPRHTLTDVIIFDLEELQTQSALLPSVPPPSLELAFDPVQARAQRQSSPRLLSLPPPSPRVSLRPSAPRSSLAPSPSGALPSAPRNSLAPASPRESLRPASLRDSLSPSSPRASLRPASPRAALGARASERLSVSILTFVTSDAVGLARKLENTLAMCRQSKHKTEVIVGCNGYDPAVLKVARSYEAQGVRLLSFRQRMGTLAVWAQVTHASKHDVVLFSDLNARMAPDTLDLLLAPMRDSEVGMTVPSYVPCIEHETGVRVRLEAATHGITAASYAGVAVRRRLLRRPAHDTVQPGLVTALQVLGEGYRVVALPAVRVFHPESTSARASFARIAQHTQGHLQAAMRQRDALSESKGMFFSMLRDGLKHIPVLLAWLGCMLTMLLFGWGLLALATLGAGALGIVSANAHVAKVAGLSWLECLGARLTAGAAQAYGLVRARS